MTIEQFITLLGRYPKESKLMFLTEVEGEESLYIDIESFDFSSNELDWDKDFILTVKIS
jgi:hypothetical protein